jgi:hypothetical protein
MIKRSCLLASLVITLVAPAAAQRETRERHIFVTVTGRDDAPARDLKASDFIVREDGTAREVVRVSPAPPPTHVALLVDDSQVIEPLVTDLRSALTGFIKKLGASTPAPAFGLTTFGERPTRQADFSASAAVVERALGRIFARQGGGAHLLDAIIETCQDLKKRSAERPVIVAFVSEEGPEFSNVLHDRVEGALAEAQASLWVVVLQGRSTGLESTEARERSRVIAEATVNSGGANKVVLSKQGLESAFTTVAAMLTSRYDIVYGRPDSLIPPSRVTVEARDKSLRVAAPRWPGR